MEEIGVVKEVIGPKAIVLVKRQSACEQCSAGGVCRGTGEGNEIEALNDAMASKGDTVKVVFKPHTYLKGSILIYGIPALALVIGAVGGKEYASAFLPGRDPDLVSAVCGFGLFILAFLIAKLYGRRVEGKKEFMPVVEEIVRS